MKVWTGLLLAGLAGSAAVVGMARGGPEGECDKPRACCSGEDRNLCCEGLAPIAALKGDWVALGEDGEPTGDVVVSYRPTSAGSAVLETLFPGSDHEMITVYYLEDGRLALTHYCALGNQPHMVAGEESSAETIRFVCAGGSNMTCARDLHMHSAAITIGADGRLHARWEGIREGKPEHEVEFHLVRKPQ
jgi:hypothetical protein